MEVKRIRRLDGQGRVILPSHIRQALNLSQNSEVTIDMTREGNILIRPAEERCCICGEGVKESPHITIESWNGPKHICKCCADQIAYAAEQIKGGLRI